MAAPLVDSTPAFVEEAYQKIEARLEKIKARLNRPLTFAEKVLLGHLDDPDDAELLAGESYMNLRPDRVGLQDVTGQMAILQFMQAGKATTAVPTTAPVAWGAAGSPRWRRCRRPTTRPRSPPATSGDSARSRTR